MNASDIRFRVYFDESTGVIKFEDTSDYDGEGIDTSTVTGIVKILGPNGTIYVNPGYESGVFTSPDISVDNDFFNEIDFVTSIVDNFDFGVYTFYYKVKIGTSSTLSVSRYFDYQVPRPVISATNTFNRNTSVLTLKDTSDYKLRFSYRDYNGVSGITPIPSPTTTSSTGSGSASIPVSKNISPYNTTRTMVIRPPYSTGLNDSISPSGSSVTFGPNCWTGNYDLYIQSLVYYNIENWGSSNWVRVIFKVYYESDVELGDSLSEFEKYASCITAINEKYESYLSSNPRRAEEYETIVNHISFYWGLYNIYKNDGRDVTYVTNKLLEILRKYEFCDSVSTTGSYEIEPLGGSTTTVETNSWSSGEEIPDATYGSNDDYFLVTTSSRVYKKISGSWQHIMTISGSGNYRDSVVITSNYSVTNSDEFIVVEATSSDITLTLDDIENFDDEKKLSIKARDLTYNIRIEAASGETIDTRSYYNIKSEGDTIEIRPVGTNWEIV